MRIEVRLGVGGLDLHGRSSVPAVFVGSMLWLGSGWFAWSWRWTGVAGRAASLASIKVRFGQKSFANSS
jgi:hypothetical protein